MRYPEPLKKGDTIGICAPSDGITKEEKIKKLEEAIKQLNELGYQVIESESVRKSEKGRSTSAKQRAKEFMQLLENKDVKLILFASGGDFLDEMLDYLDWEKIKEMKPKWMQGYSDITGINFLFNTILEIPSMYCQTVKDYAMRPLYRNLKDAIEIVSGNEITQTSFEKYEIKNEEVEENPNATYNLTEKVEWKNLTGEQKIIMQGRALGGCLDCIQSIFGTKYDNIKEYIKKHREEGVIWFLECFEVGTATLTRWLWQMKNAGYFEYCKGIIFGRPLFVRNDYDITFNEAVLETLGDLNIPIITDADIGHVSPQLAIVNGAILKITSEKGKGIVETFLK